MNSESSFFNFPVIIIPEYYKLFNPKFCWTHYLSVIQFLGVFMKKLGFLLIVLFATVGFNSCSKKDAKNEVAEEVAKTEATVAAPAKLPDPSGTYKDSEGMMSYDFYSTGKFYMTFVDNSGSGTWERIGNTIELTDESGMSAGSLELGNGVLTWPNGKTLNKQ